MDVLDVFRMCMPEAYMREHMIPSINQHLDGKITLSELYVWLGYRFFMACFVGVSPMSLWWSKKDVDQFEGAPFRLNNVMSLNRFQAIDKAMQYTNRPPPTEFVDRFDDMRQLQDAFNAHYEESYIPSSLNCFGESMNTWFDQKCPGFMVVDPKPLPYF